MSFINTYQTYMLYSWKEIMKKQMSKKKKNNNRI